MFSIKGKLNSKPKRWNNNNDKSNNKKERASQETNVKVIMAQLTAEEGLKVKVEKYLRETPKLDDGLKTLLSLTIAKNQTTSKEQTRKPLSASICLELIRSLSLAINKIELLEPLAWASKFPQKRYLTKCDNYGNSARGMRFFKEDFVFFELLKSYIFVPSIEHFSM